MAPIAFAWLPVAVAWAPVAFASWPVAVAETTIRLAQLAGRGGGGADSVGARAGRGGEGAVGRAEETGRGRVEAVGRGAVAVGRRVPAVRGRVEANRRGIETGDEGGRATSRKPCRGRKALREGRRDAERRHHARRRRDAAQRSAGKHAAGKQMRAGSGRIKQVREVRCPHTGCRRRRNRPQHRCPRVRLKIIGSRKTKLSVAPYLLAYTETLPNLSQIGGANNR